MIVSGLYYARLITTIAQSKNNNNKNEYVQPMCSRLFFIVVIISIKADCKRICVHSVQFEWQMCTRECMCECFVSSASLMATVFPINMCQTNWMDVTDDDDKCSDTKWRLFPILVSFFLTISRISSHFQ